jgi:hypothetical protein
MQASLCFIRKKGGNRCNSEPYEKWPVCPLNRNTYYFGPQNPSPFGVYPGWSPARHREEISQPTNALFTSATPTTVPGSSQHLEQHERGRGATPSCDTGLGICSLFVLPQLIAPRIMTQPWSIRWISLPALVRSFHQVRTSISA